MDLLLLCPQNRDVRIIANATEDEDVWPEDYDNDATTLKPMRSVDPAFPSQDEVAAAVAAARDAIVADDAMCPNGDARSVVTEHLKGTFPTYQSWGLDIPPDLLRAMTNEVRSRHIALIDTLSAELVDEFIEQVTPALAASKSVEELITGAKLLLSTRIACNCLTRNTAKGLAREAKFRAKTQLASRLDQPLSDAH